MANTTIKVMTTMATKKTPRVMTVMVTTKVATTRNLTLANPSSHAAILALQNLKS